MTSAMTVGYMFAWGSRTETRLRIAVGFKEVSAQDEVLAHIVQCAYSAMSTEAIMISFGVLEEMIREDVRKSMEKEQKA